MSFRVAAVLFSVAWLVPFFGLIDLGALVALPRGDGVGIELDNSMLSVTYGSVATLLVAAAFIAQLWAPQAWPASTQQVLGAAIAFGVAGCLGLDVASLVSVATLVVMLAILLLLHPLPRPALFPNAQRASRPLLVVAAVGAVPWLVYAWNMSANSRAQLLPDQDAARPQAGGWAGAAVMGIAVLLLALLAATRTPGWRLPLWTTAVTAMTFGVVAMINPALPGSPERYWGLLATAWGLTLILAAELQCWHDRR